MIVVAADWKFCPRCKLCLPRTPVFFYFNGEKVSWCRDCKRKGASDYRRTMNSGQRARLRESSRVSRNKSRRENPEREHAWQAANWRRVKADRVRYVLTRQDRRIDYYLRIGRGATMLDADAIGAYRPVPSKAERLNPEPFLAWLQDRYRGQNADEIGALLGVPSRTLRALLAGQQHSVRLTFVDEAVTRIGRPDLLNDLYPLDTA